VTDLWNRRWTNVVQKDSLLNLGTSCWRKTGDREEQRLLLREARKQKVLVPYMDRLLLLLLLLLLTAIGLSPGGTSPTLVQTKIQIHKTTKTTKNYKT
jgi:hypothetical protein